MHGCCSESSFLVDAEVDSMRGAIDSRVGTSVMTSPCRAEIEKTQEEIRLENDCREERLRELEFLEKGGDPLDFKFCHAVSVSVQSTSLANQHPDQIVTSKAKDSYEAAALRSRHEDAVESFGKLGDTTCEANSGDNLLLIDGENKLHTDESFNGHAGKSCVTPSEVSTRTGGNHKDKGSEDSAIFRPYARRNRSKSNRDGARLGYVDVSHARNQGSTHLRPGSMDAKGSSSDANRKDQKLPSICKLKLSNGISKMALKNDSSRNVESVAMSIAETPADVHVNCKDLASDAKSNGHLLECIKDHGKSQDAKSYRTDLEAEETTELANCASRLSDAPTTARRTGNVGQSNVLAIPEEINCPHLDSTTTNLGIPTPKNDRDGCSNLICEDSTEHRKELTLVNNEDRKPVSEDPLVTNINPEAVGTSSAAIFDDIMLCDIKSGSVIKVEEDIDFQNKSVTSELLKTTELEETKELQANKNADTVIDHKSSPINDGAEVQISTVSPVDEDSKNVPSGGATTDKDVPDDACNKKLADKMDEDSVLSEAKIILAKCKRIAELSTRSLPLKSCQKSHWDFLLEEVAWLANDFMQERVWKVTAAAQLVRHSALSFHERHQNQMPVRRLKFVAYSLAKAVMKFWHTCEMLDAPDSLEPQSPHKSLALKSYALRFLRYNNSATPSIKAENSVTAIDVHGLRVQETSGESCITEEGDNLFYVIPTGAMQCYRTSIESYVLQFEKNGSMQKEDDAPIHEVNEETMEMSQDNIFDEDEGETSLQYLPGTVEWNKASHFPHKKQKGLKRTYSSGSYELRVDLAYGSRVPGSQKYVSMFKRSATQNLVSIPRKRMRTASRQRVLGSSSGAGPVNVLAMNKTDASSEDTNSYQDEQGSLHGGSHMQRSLEFESPVDFENYLPIDSEEISTKDKNMGDHSRRRLESHHHGSNEGNGLLGHHKPKKRKISKQTYENLLDISGPLSGLMPSPATCRMSNMSSANEYKRMIAYKDSLKKTKGTKLPISMSGPGNAWTSFEDQALVVLVHDLGPNWDLVSDAINSTLQVKHIFREPKECKERHKLLMDQTAGDAADNADDSGSSQPYPSTMPGIPKGSARQLFQRLHGPMEEDLVKSHFEKIIMIGQRHYHRRKQSDSHDQKHVAPPHNSHLIAISQVSSNNLNGGFLTPFDLIDAIMSSPDALALGYHCPQTNGFTNQSCVPPVLPPGTSVGNNLSSPSGPSTHWNGRYCVSLPSLPIDDQQRVQQSNSLLSGRNIQQSPTSVPGPQPLSERFGRRKLQGSNGMGMVNGINNRGKPMSRPGFQGLGSSAMLDSAAVLSSGMVGMQTLDMQSISMHRHMDKSYQIRPGQSQESHIQKLVPKMQMRATQANSCITPSNGLNGSNTGQTGPSSGQSCSAHHQQEHQKSSQQSHDLTIPHLKVPSHAIGSQHPAYAHLVKERQLQQQIFQQQQQYNASNAMIPLAQQQQQQQQQLLVSMQNSSQVQPQTSHGVSLSSISPSSPLVSVNSLQQKRHLPPHGLPRDSQSGSNSLPNQIPKQRLRHPQQQQQSVRPLTTQQRQQLQGKQIKGEGRGNLNPPVDQSSLNGQSLLSSPGGQSTDEGVQAVRGQGSHNSVQPSRSHRLHTASQSQSQQVSPLLQNGNLGISHPTMSSHSVSSPNHPRIQSPSNSHHKPVGQTQMNVAGGPENSPHLSQLDDQIVNGEAPSIGDAATTSQISAELLDERSEVILQQQTPESLHVSPIQK